MQKLFGRGALTLQSGYLTEEHLLIVDGRFQERYKRLKYSDIQALLIRQTGAGKVAGLFGGLGGFLFVIVALTHLDSRAWIVWAVIALISWSIFGLTLYGRGSVQMGVQTAVQTVYLDGVKSLRRAEKVADTLSVRIESAQGRLEPEALRAALEAQRAGRKASDARGEQNRPQMPPPVKEELKPPPLQPDVE